jgi:hypothetical protein
VASAAKKIGIPIIESAYERRRRLRAFDHDKVIVLPLKARCRKVSGARAQQPPVALIALEVHRRGGFVLGHSLDAGRLGDVPKDPRWRALGKLGAVEIDAHLDAAISSACKRLDDRPVGQDIRGQVDFMLGAFNQRPRGFGWRTIRVAVMPVVTLPGFGTRLSSCTTGVGWACSPRPNMAPARDCLCNRAAVLANSPKEGFLGMGALRALISNSPG